MLPNLLPRIRIFLRKLIKHTPIRSRMLQSPHIPPRTRMVRPHLRPLTLHIRPNTVPRPRDDLARRTDVARAPRQVGRVVRGEGGGGFGEALVVELGVFGFLVGARDGGD